MDWQVNKKNFRLVSNFEINQRNLRGIAPLRASETLAVNYFPSLFVQGKGFRKLSVVAGSCLVEFLGGALLSNNSFFNSTHHLSL